MRDVHSRTFYCPKTEETVTLIEYTRVENGCEAVCGILSCSHQDMCRLKKEDGEDDVFPWGRCPACRDRENEKCLKL